MTVIEAFDINPAKTYSIKEYRSGVSNVNLFTDIPGVKFSTKTLSFFGSLCAIVEPLQKMKIVNKTPKKQITPFKVGASTLTDSP